ncbi:MAG: UDP-N-acetylmuramate dehydrogenase [Candidatus Electryonea clarkiae]|nr:UDP-N-acetylmuramate dehydrogenase [Candidatus Electryonea clarkiae]MDP8288725.1 UDP-N-acetylmuramate dehydrogenase [Candidatus Electryonea clarkiae]
MIDVNSISALLKDIDDIKLKYDHKLAPYTSYGVGGAATFWVEPYSEVALRKVLEIINEAEVPLFVLGGGCNVLVSDDGWHGVVLHTGDNLSGWTFEGNTAKVLAGTVLEEFIGAAVEGGLGGMEKMFGIPGSVGGALRMNAGAFGQEIESRVTSVNGFTLSGKPFEMSREEIGFDYRKAHGLEDKVIVSAQFELIDDDHKTLLDKMYEVKKMRSEKQPLDFPSCGSVFKRPSGHYAGTLIEDAGMKGKRLGGAKVSEKHAGFILNVDNAKANDIYQLMQMVEKAVKEKSGVQLEREVKVIGSMNA